MEDILCETVDHKRLEENVEDQDADCMSEPGMCGISVSVFRFPAILGSSVPFRVPSVLGPEGGNGNWWLFNTGFLLHTIS
ncbi:unnamed protein product [Heligmosomoides polygyrus]|uniref:SLC11A1 n=1 Tax=Heligmosomoides polygyrus TaxID=6339 RepID=A0A183G206_HELPZ|nr:unnamed protein product [Heligmosomoides polygyrus]